MNFRQGNEISYKILKVLNLFQVPNYQAKLTIFKEICQYSKLKRFEISQPISSLKLSIMSKQYNSTFPELTYFHTNTFSCSLFIANQICHYFSEI